METTSDVAVTYVSEIHTSFFDNLYGSGLTFARGQTRAVPALLADSLLRHTGEFERASEQPKPARIGRATFEPKVVATNIPGAAFAASARWPATP